MIDVSLGIVRKGNRVLLIKRGVPEGDLLWQFPGGKVENNEDPDHAACREVLEETNIKCTVINSLGTRIIESRNVKVHYFACKYQTGEIKCKTGEVDDVKWIKPNELKKFITTDLHSTVSEFLIPHPKRKVKKLSFHKLNNFIYRRQISF